MERLKSCIADLKKLATVYADGDASSLPSRDVRQRTLSEGQRESTETVPEAIRELEAGRRFAAEGARLVLCASRLGAHGDLEGTLEEAAADDD